MPCLTFKSRRRTSTFRVINSMRRLILYILALGRADGLNTDLMRLSIYADYYKEVEIVGGFKAKITDF